MTGGASVRAGTRAEDMSYLLSFLRNESGATAIEYAIIAAGLSIAIVATVQGIGSSVNTMFTSVSTALK
jgi:pilus assembly protein Flp/PilA